MKIFHYQTTPPGFLAFPLFLAKISHPSITIIFQNSHPPFIKGGGAGGAGGVRTTNFLNHYFCHFRTFCKSLPYFSFSLQLLAQCNSPYKFFIRGRNNSRISAEQNVWQCCNSVGSYVFLSDFLCLSSLVQPFLSLLMTKVKLLL